MIPSAISIIGTLVHKDLSDVNIISTLFRLSKEQSLLKSLKASYQIRNTQQLISLISFKKNNIIGKKIKKIGKTILNKTTKEIDKFIYNENKKT